MLDPFKILKCVKYLWGMCSSTGLHTSLSVAALHCHALGPSENLLVYSQCVVAACKVNIIRDEGGTISTSFTRAQLEEEGKLYDELEGGRTEVQKEREDESW